MSIEVGQKITGKVTGITHFGAFISLPDNKTGLVHISEVSDGYVKEISSVLTVGQEVAVKVLSIADDGKISLSIRQASDRPAEAPARTKRERQEGAAPHNQRAPRFKSRQDEGGNRPNFNNAGNNNSRKLADFDQLMSNFLKDSEDRLSSLRRNTEGKRGGRGGRRS